MGGEQRTDTHAALQSEQRFHLTARVNPGLLRIPRGRVQSLEARGAAGAPRLAFDGKSGGSEGPDWRGTCEMIVDLWTSGIAISF